MEVGPDFGDHALQLFIDRLGLHPIGVARLDLFQFVIDIVCRAPFIGQDARFDPVTTDDPVFNKREILFEVRLSQQPDQLSIRIACIGNRQIC